MSDDEEDPFEGFEESAADREGDPFVDLDGDASDGGGEDPAGSGGERPGVPDPDDGRDAFTEHGEVDAPPGTRSGDADVTGPGDPGDLTPAGGRDGTEEEGRAGVGADADRSPADEAAEPFVAPEQREGDPFEDAESAFERMDIQELDPDEVWESLADAQQRGSVAEMEERSYAEVSKHSFCEQCEYFSAPPDVRCNHEGTEILEFVDMESVRVVDCPVVAERKRLQQE
jgi:hypothetical protein